MAMTPEVSDLVNKIKTEQSANKMRGYIADGLKSTNEKAVNTDGRQDVLRSDFVSLGNQFKDVIDSTTGKDVISAPEIIAARSGEIDLNARLTKNEQEVTAQLAQTVGVDIKDFGVLGDGVTDDTENIQNALDSPLPIFWSEGTYYFKKVTLSQNNKKIVFSPHVVLKSDHNIDLPQEASFSIEGKESGTSTQLTNSVVKGSPVLQVNGVSGFAIGDLVQVTQDDVSVVDQITHEQQYALALVTIKSIDSLTNEITVQEPIHHNFNTGLNAKITKIEPVENVIIVGNETVFDKMGTTEYTNHLSVHYGRNIVIDGLILSSGGGKGVSIYNTTGFKVTNIVRKRPTNTSAGHGYGAQSNASEHGVFDNITAYDSRHTVDITTASNNITISNSNGFNSDFHTHGTNSQHITFVDCNVYGEGFSIGNFSFMSDHDINLIRCSSTNSPSSGFGVHAKSYNIKIQNSHVISSPNGMIVNNNCENVEITSSVVKDIGNVGIELRGIGIRMNNVSIIDAEYMALVTSGDCHDVVVNTLDIRSEKFTSNAGVRLNENTHDVVMTNVSLIGNFSRAMRFTETTKNITFNQLKLDVEAIRAVEVSGVLDINLKINGGFLRNTDNGNMGVYSDRNTSNIVLKNVDLHSNISFQGSDGFTMIGNALYDVGVNISATQNVHVLNNFGDVKSVTAPETGGSCLVENNLFNVA